MAGEAKRRWWNGPEPIPFNQPRPLVASAQRIRLNDPETLEDMRLRGSNASWQKEAWIYYDAIGEIKFAFGLLASVMSRLRLYAAAVLDPESPPTRVADAATIPRPEGEETTDYHPPKGIDPRLAKEAHDTLTKLFRRTSVPGLLRSFALNASVPGECYLMLHNDQWVVKSTSEVKIDTSGRAVMTRTKGGKQNVLPESLTIGRIWREHPEFSADADSSMRALLADCEELLLLSKMIRASSRGRLNAGILFVPDEVTVSRNTPTDDPEIEAEEESSFEAELVQAMTAPITDERAANSVIPLLLRGNAELADKIKHIEITRKIDPELVTRADRTLERILQGIDIPKDVVTGLANVKYSNAIQIDENLYKAHVEPLALMLVDAITEICLRPVLAASGKWTDEQIAQIVVWYDPSEVVTRPDRAADAQQGWDNYLISGDAWRQTRGFSDADQPGEEELAKRLALEKAEVPPEIASVLFNFVLPLILGKAKTEAREDGRVPMPDDLAAMLDGSAETPDTVVTEQSTDGVAAAPAAAPPPQVPQAAAPVADPNMPSPADVSS